MRPEEVNVWLLKEHEVIEGSNGCFPFAFAGMMALQFPEMSKADTMKVVKEIFRPVKTTEQLYRRRHEVNYREPYDKVKGSCRWAHLVYKGFGSDLKWDVNARLEKMEVPLIFGFYQGNDYQEFERLLNGGSSILPTFSMHDDSKTSAVSDYHTACFHRDPNRNLFYIDSNRDEPEIVYDGFLEEIVVGGTRSLYGVSKGGAKYLGYDKPIAFCFKKKEDDNPDPKRIY